jgi:hypothetical protein
MHRVLLETLTPGEFAMVVRKEVEAALNGVRWAVLDIDNCVLGRALPGAVVAELEAALDAEPPGPGLDGLTAEEAEMVEAAARVVGRARRPKGVP